MAHSPRGWTGARTPSAIKRVRQTQRKRAINQPRRTAAKTLVTKALSVATDTAAGIAGTPEEVATAVQRAVSALDKAAKIGAIHRNAADRRKSRLMLKVNAALGGDGVVGAAKASRQTGKAAAAKQAKARIAASRATKAKGAQTAAGKARAALARTTRDTSTEKAAPSATDEATTPRRAPSRPAAKAGTKPATTTKASAATKTSSAKSSAKTAATKASAAKGSSAKSAPSKSTTKASAAKTTKPAAKKS